MKENKSMNNSNTEERAAKMQLALKINALIKERNFTKKDIAKFLSISEEKITDLSNGALSNFTLGKLFNFLVLLGQNITFNITPKKETKKKP